MSRPIQNLVSLKQSTQQIRALLRSVDGIDVARVDDVDKIKLDSNLAAEGASYRFAEVDGELHLTLDRENYTKVVKSVFDAQQEVRRQREAGAKPEGESSQQSQTGADSASQEAPSSETPKQQHVEDALHLQQTNLHDDLSPFEQTVNHSLVKVSDILRRVFNRRTGLMSWILTWSLKSAGLREIDANGEDQGSINNSFTDVQNRLVDADFTKKFAKVLELTERSGNYSKSDVNDAISKIFEGDKVGQSLAKLAQFTRATSNALPKEFIKWFPRVFSIANMAVPLVSKMFFKNSSIGHALEWVRVFMPAADEFVNTYTALCGDEMNKIKEDVYNPDRNKIETCHVDEDGKVCNESDAEYAIGTVELSEMDSEGFRFQQVRDELSSGFKRLFGRERNLVGWVVNLAVRGQGGFKDYEDFERQVIKDPRVLHETYNHLKEKNAESSEELFDGIGERFGNSVQENTSKSFLGVMSLVNNLSEDFINKVPKAFGLPYSFFYLGSPIVSKVLNKTLGENSWLAWGFDWLSRLAPIINDCGVDILASGFEEAKFSKEVMQSEASRDLFEGLPAGKAATKAARSVLWDGLTSMFDAVKSRFVSSREDIDQDAPAQPAITPA